MKPRTSLLLLVIAVLALAVGWQYGLRTQPAQQQTVAPGTLVFPGLAPKLALATRVEITHQGKTLVIASHDNVWGLADRGGYPVQPSRMRQLLTGLAELRITERRTADPTEFGRLGVDDPALATSTSNLVRVLDVTGTPIAQLIVGHRRVRTQGNLPESVYIRRPGENQSWLAEGGVPVDADPQLWVDRDIMSIDHSKIARVVVHRGEATLTFSTQDGKLVLSDPADHPKLDDYKLEDVGRALEQLTLTDVEPSAKEPGTAIGSSEITTTDGMTIEAKLFMADKDLWAQFAVTGGEQAQQAAAALQAEVGPWAYQLSSWKEAALAPTLDDLKAATPETPTPPAPATAPTK